MSEFRLIELPTFPDSRGQLTVMQQVLPFEIRRVFWITQADNMLRGGHRHHDNRQGLIAIAGAVTVSMNDGNRKEVVRLTRQNQCLLVEPDDWHTMAFGPGAVLLVFASHLYDVKDYIDAEY